MTRERRNMSLLVDSIVPADYNLSLNTLKKYQNTWTLKSKSQKCDTWGYQQYQLSLDLSEWLEIVQIDSFKLFLVAKIKERKITAHTVWMALSTKNMYDLRFFSFVLFFFSLKKFCLKYHDAISYVRTKVGPTKELSVHMNQREKIIRIITF